MDALAIQPEKASHAPAGQSPPSGLGGLFQILLRDSGLPVDQGRRDTEDLPVSGLVGLGDEILSDLELTAIVSPIPTPLVPGSPTPVPALLVGAMTEGPVDDHPISDRVSVAGLVGVRPLGQARDLVAGLTAGLQNLLGPGTASPDAPTAAPPARISTGPGLGAQGVEIRPTGLVAPPRAALGGGAVTAALAGSERPGLEEPGTVGALGRNAAIAPAPIVPTAEATAPRTDPRGSGAPRQGASPETIPAPATPLPTIPPHAIPPQGAGAMENVVDLRAPRDAPLAKRLIQVGSARFGPAQAARVRRDGGTAVAGQGAASAGPKPIAARAQGMPMATSGSGFEAAGGPSSTASGAAPTDTFPNSAVPSGGGQAGTQSLEPAPQQARPAGAPPTPLDQVAVHIRQAASTGANRIRIRLHPAELGQVEVKLEVSPDGLVKAIVTLDKAETFDLFQRDARGLEKALQDAGLKTESNSLSFNLRDGGREGFSGRRETPDPDTHAEIGRENPTELPPLDSNRALDLRI